MGWDEISSQPQSGQTGTAVAIETPAARRSDTNDNLHSLFIKDILDPTASANAPSPESLRRAVEATSQVAQPKIEPKALQQTPAVYASPRAVEAAPTYAMPPSNVRPLYAAPDRSYSGMPQGDSLVQGRAPGRADMTYSAMRNRMMVAQGNDMPPMNNQAQAELAGRRRGFQPQQIFQPRRPETPPPGAPQEQQRQRLLGRGGLFRGDQPAQNQPLQKFDFNAQNETGVVKEISLPANYKEAPKDPNIAPGDDPIKREYQSPNGRVSIYEGRELTPDEQKSMKTIFAKQGKLAPNTPAYDEACAIMGAGYHNFAVNPQFTVGKFNGRDAVFLTDEDKRAGLTGYTVLIPSDKGQFLYAVSFQGQTKDFPQVKKGLDTIKWRPTPDAVAPPSPNPRKGP